jgi:hypothetical protein
MYGYQSNGQPLQDFMKTKILPNGTGTATLDIEASGAQLCVTGPIAKDTTIAFDWYSDKLQAMVYDQGDEPVVYVRYNDDGTIAEIEIAEHVRHLIHDPRLPSEWKEARDKKETEQYEAAQKK